MSAVGSNFVIHEHVSPGVTDEGATGPFAPTSHPLPGDVVASNTVALLRRDGEAARDYAREAPVTFAIL